MAIIMNHTLAQTLQLPWTGPSGTATTTQIEGKLAIPGVSGNLTLGNILSVALPTIFMFAGIGLLLMLISSGFSFLTSAGDPKKLEKAKGTLSNAIVGFIIIFASFWVVQIAKVMFGLGNAWSFIGN